MTLGKIQHFVCGGEERGGGGGTRLNKAERGQESEQGEEDEELFTQNYTPPGKRDK